MHFHFILKLKCAVRMKNLNSENGPFGPSSESDSKFIGIKVIAMLVLFDFKYVAIFTSIEYFFPLSLYQTDCDSQLYAYGN